MNRDTSSQLPLRRRMLGQAYKKSDMQGRMNIVHYSKYVDLMYDCNASDELVEQIILRAIGKFGDSVEMWTIYMKHCMRTNDSDRVKIVFEQSIKRLTKGAATLWVLYINYLKTLPDSSSVKLVYVDALKQMNPEFDEIKISYIDWACTMGGIKLADNIFKMANHFGTLTIGMVKKLNELKMLHVRSLFFFFNIT